jgi:hypothetical protein
VRSKADKLMLVQGAAQQAATAPKGGLTGFSLRSSLLNSEPPQNAKSLLQIHHKAANRAMLCLTAAMVIVNKGKPCQANVNNWFWPS